MDSLIVAVAQHLPFVVPVVAGMICLALPRHDTVGLGLGAMLLAASILVGVARVAAHVHHGQDIVTGVLIALVAVGITTATLTWARPRLPRRLAEPALA